MTEMTESRRHNDRIKHEERQLHRLKRAQNDD
jgi:hypothetical protein